MRYLLIGALGIGASVVSVDILVELSAGSLLAVAGVLPGTTLMVLAQRAERRRERSRNIAPNTLPAAGYGACAEDPS